MSVNTQHKDYQANLSTWKLMRDVISSNVTSYVPKLEGQSTDEFKAYVNRPAFFNATSRTLEALLGLIFSKPAEVTDSTELNKIYENITLDDDTLEDFSKSIAKEVLTVGRCGVLVDLPSIDRSQFSASQIEAMNLRAYARLYTTENIINWRYETVNGINFLSLVVLQETYEYINGDEFSVETGTRWRVLDLVEGRYRQRIYTQNKDSSFSFDAEYYPVANGKPITYIPFTFFGVNELKGKIEQPPLLDMAKVNISHFKNDVDLEHGAHFTALPTPCISGYSGQQNEVIKIGSSSFLTFDNPQAKAYYMEFSGDGLGTIQDIIALKEKRMAVLGARLLLDEKKTAEATETVAMRSSGERAVLINIALTLSSGLKKVLSIIAEWENIKQEIVYNLNTDYNLSTMDAQLLAQIIAGVQGGTIPPQVLYHNMKNGELIPDEMDYEMFQANIETATPQLSVNNARTTA